MARHLFAIVLALWTWVACADPSLSISFEVPLPYRHEDLATVSLDVWSFSDVKAANCDSVAFGLLDLATARLELSKYVSYYNAQHFPLAGIDRVAPKLFVAKAYNGRGDAVVAACAEVHEAVQRSTDVVLRGEATTRLRVETPASQLQDPSTSGSTAMVRVVVTDYAASALRAAQVRWETVGAGGVGKKGIGVADEQGVGAIVVEKPGLPGPWSLGLRSRWQLGTPQLLRGMENLATQDWTLPGFASASMVAGRIGPNGEPGFVALGFAFKFGGGQELLYRYYDIESGSLQGGRVNASAESANSIMVSSDGLSTVLVPGKDRDHVLVRQDNAWQKLAINDHQLVPFYSPPPDRTLGPACAVGTCGTSREAQILLQLNASDRSSAYIWEVVDASGKAVSGHPLRSSNQPLGLKTCGCVQDDQGNEHPVVVATTSANGWRALAVVDGQVVTRDKTGLFSVVGFASEASSQLGRHMWAGAVDGEGARVSSMYLSLPTQQSGLYFETFRDEPVFNVPLVLQGARLDKDGIPDMAALTMVTSPQGEKSLYLLTHLGVQHRGKGVAGFVNLGSVDFTTANSGTGGIGTDEGGAFLASLGLVGLWVIDINNDGFDEILVNRGWSVEGSAAPATKLTLFSIKL